VVTALRSVSSLWKAVLVVEKDPYLPMATFEEVLPKLRSDHQALDEDISQTVFGRVLIEERERRKRLDEEGEGVKSLQQEREEEDLREEAFHTPTTRVGKWLVGFEVRFVI
jgi:hypothetical protein